MISTYWPEGRAGQENIWLDVGKYRQHSAVLNSGYYLNLYVIGMLTCGKTKRNDPQNDELQKMIGIEAQCKSMEPCPLFTSVVHNFS